MNAQFIKSVVDAAKIKVFKTRHGGKPSGRYGFAKLIVNPATKRSDALEVSRKDYRTESEAYAAAHTHYRLRAS